MRFLLKAFSSNSDYPAGCDYAVVDGTEDLIKLALRRIDTLHSESLSDALITEAHYWDCSAQYFSPWLNGACRSDAELQACFKLEEAIEHLGIDREEVVIAPPDFNIPENQIASVECRRMVVRDSGIIFRASAKHASVSVTTAEIPRQLIESVLQSAEH